jgi:thioredoxin 1
MQNISQLDRNNFKDFIEQHPFVIVQFGANWCEPCKQFNPVFEAVASTLPAIAFARVDVDGAADIAAYFNVKQVPCFLAIRDRIVLDAVYGEMKQHEFKHHIEMWSAFDMTAINAHFDTKETAI